ncbi:Amino acid transporter transmembrane [Carpediemonas membranifera]|uniref:Amino acid transporter transmembrane n=1 Tax=Carpediemonas membranifera TaxID=201153 RepID=A0A8J6BDG6_9EUKA|nr:Amino acid transporter transmembrane [Carpediemonas membranifera]|eukprot:KAG9395202.1 Amino acid transporter transmembrane [Carpediemonas membranifera]
MESDEILPTETIRSVDAEVRTGEYYHDEMIGETLVYSVKAEQGPDERVPEKEEEEEATDTNEEPQFSMLDDAFSEAKKELSADDNAEPADNASDGSEDATLAVVPAPAEPDEAEPHGIAHAFTDHAELVNSKLETLSKQGEVASREQLNCEDLGDAGMLSSIFNIANTILGAGTVTLPYAFKSAGIALGLVLIVASYLMMTFSMRVLVRACHRLSPRLYSYRALAQKCFGRWAGPVIELLIALLTTGVLIAYTVIIGDYVSSLAESYLPFLPFLHSPLVIRIVVVVAVIFPLCCLKSLRLLSFTSGISVVCVLFTTLFVTASCLFSLGQGDAAVLNGGVTWFKFDFSAFMATCLFSSAFAAHFTLPSIYQELKKKELSLLSPPETPAPESDPGSPGATNGALQFVSVERRTHRRAGSSLYPEVEEGHATTGAPEPFAFDSSALGNMSPLRRSRAGSVETKKGLATPLRRAMKLRKDKAQRIAKSGSDRDWRRIWTSLSLGLVICLVVYSLVGISGYLEFGDDGTADNILMSYTGTNVGRDLALAAMSAVIVFSMPLVHFAARQSVLNAIWSVVRRKPYSFGWVSHVGCAVVMMVVSLVVATLLPSVSTIFNLLFATAGTMVYICLPGVFYLRFRTSFQSKAVERTKWTSQLRDKSAWAAVALILISGPLGVMSVVSNFI